MGILDLFWWWLALFWDHRLVRKRLSQQADVFSETRASGIRGSRKPSFLTL
jgi:hypothetical protein